MKRERTTSPLYRCRQCQIRMLERDRAGHLERSHPGPEEVDLERWFEVDGEVPSVAGDAIDGPIIERARERSLRGHAAKQRRGAEARQRRKASYP